MVGVIQLGIGTGIARANPSDGNPPPDAHGPHDRVGGDPHDRMERERHDREERERIERDRREWLERENRRHEEETRRRHGEDERAWYERQEGERVRHERFSRESGAVVHAAM